MKQKAISGLAGLALAVASGPALSAVKGEVGLYYDFMHDYDLLGALSGDGDGFGVVGSFDFGGPTAHFEYRSAEADLDQAPGAQEEETTYRIGGGYRMAVNPQLGISGRLEYLDREDDVASGALVIDSDGFGLHVGVDFAPMPELNLGASLGYMMLDGEVANAPPTPGIDVGSTGLEYSLSAAYIINKVFAVSLTWRQYNGELEDCSGGCGGDGKTYEFGGLMLGGSYRFSM